MKQWVMNRPYKYAIAAVMAGLLICFSHTALAVNLKQNIQIDKEIIQLGDVFDGLTEHQDYVLARAPEPGRQTVFDAYTLSRIATAFGLDWRASHRFQKAVVERSATLIDHETIAQALERNLNDQVKGKFSVRLNNPNFSITLPTQYSPFIDVVRMDVDHKRNRFTARIKTDDQSKGDISITGRIVNIMDMPVLSSRLRKGDIIRESDLDWIEVDESLLTSRMIMDADKIIGMTPRQIIKANSIITENDIVKPKIVKKGDIVMMQLKNGFMDLTTKGRALEDGARDDIIRVMNLNSDQVIDAEVTGNQEVTVFSTLKTALR